MGIVTLDEVSYDTELLSDDANSIVAHLVEADTKMREAQIMVGLMKSASVSLINDLKTNHLTDEAIATEEVEITEE